MNIKLGFLFAALTMSGCTSITVEPVPTQYQLSQICIEKNDRVLVDEFLPVIQKRLQHHGIKTKIIHFEPEFCEYSLKYTALRSWDFTLYMSHAELWLYKGYEQIAYGKFHLNGKGGLSLSKFDSVEDKMNPVVDQLLENVSKRNAR